MKILRAIWNRLRSVTRQRAVKLDIDEELGIHIVQRTASRFTPANMFLLDLFIFLLLSNMSEDIIVFHEQQT